MHVLIIPSEEYIPKSNQIAGIFQHDQARIIQQKGNIVGVLSFTFKHSFSTLIKSLLGKKNKHTKNLSKLTILKLIIRKLISPKKSSLTYQQIDNINVVRCDGFWGLKSSSKEIDKYNLWLKLGEYTLKKYIHKNGKPDIIHAHNMIYAGLFALHSKKRFNIPVVVTEHSSQYAMEGVSKELDELLKNAFKGNENFYAVSPKLIELLSNKFSLERGKIEWLPNVLDLEIEEKELPKQLSKKAKFRFINIANLIPLKGQKELIEAFSLAFKGNDNIELIIAGQGPLAEELENLIKQKRITDKVKLIGLIDRKEVVNQLDNSDVLVLPSHYETFGVVLIEALSRGIPVISTYCGGPECIVNDTNGILVESKNIEALSKALRLIQANYSKYNKKKIRKLCIENFGKEKFYFRLNEIYDISK